jgi:hypothetical protein
MTLSASTEASTWPAPTKPDQNWRIASRPRNAGRFGAISTASSAYVAIIWSTLPAREAALNSASLARMACSASFAVDIVDAQAANRRVVTAANRFMIDLRLE